MMIWSFVWGDVVYDMFLMIRWYFGFGDGDWMSWLLFWMNVVFSVWCCCIVLWKVFFSVGRFGWLLMCRILYRFIWDLFLVWIWWVYIFVWWVDIGIGLDVWSFGMWFSFFFWLCWLLIIFVDVCFLFEYVFICFLFEDIVVIGIDVMIFLISFWMDFVLSILNSERLIMVVFLNYFWNLIVMIELRL